MSNIITPLPRLPLGTPLNPLQETAKGLVFYWRGIPAGNVVDESPYGNHGTIVGATWVGNGLDFNSTGEVNIGTAFNDLPTTYNFTIIIWAQASTHVGSKAAFGINGTDDIVIYPFDTAGGNTFRVFWRDLDTNMIQVVHSKAGLEFHQFVFASYAANDHRAYIDGLLVDSSSATGTAGPFSDDAFIGAFNSGSQNFHGSISDVSIYKRALSASEIAALYINPALPMQQPPIWLFKAPVVGVTMAAHYYRHLMQGVA